MLPYVLVGVPGLGGRARVHVELLAEILVLHERRVLDVVGLPHFPEWRRRAIRLTVTREPQYSCAYASKPRRTAEAPSWSPGYTRMSFVFLLSSSYSHARTHSEMR